MFPHERSLVKRLEGKPFVLLGVNADDKDTAEEIKKKNEKQQITWRSFRNKRPSEKDQEKESAEKEKASAEKSGSIAEDWNLQGFPTLFLIDHKGVIRKKWIGAPSEKALDKAIEEVVKEAEGTTSGS